ncbi:MAG: hypothetical protein E7J29_05105 [Veillonella sp.]|uniref:hypothetical protein n=1 Tax=Veillonella sp. TaxID=1926307 RepID=UPI00290B0EDC|nr:hypothetical protein [Veillonella sp.]MDU7876121.1 hypothetical protein [Veillonella sp.]MDU7936293.1 hypothetical protein [Veillonella sp.]
MMKKSIVRTSLALAVAGVLGTSVVAYAAEAPQVQPVPVVKEAVQTAPVVKQEATAPKIDVSAAIKPVANENTKPVVTETAKPVDPEAAKPEAPKTAATETAKPAVNETAQPVVVPAAANPAAANPAAASMDVDTTPVVAKADKKDSKTTKVVKADKKDHKTTKVVKSNKKAQSAPAVKADKAHK